MSFDPGLEQKFKGMFQKRLQKKLRDFQETLSPKDSETSRKYFSDSTAKPSDEGRTRYVQRWWPRDPHGPTFEYGWAGGKMTSNGNYQWGATLLDFFSTNRVPIEPKFILSTSGSRLASFARRIGEKECAWCQEELDWADAEEDPKELFPVDTGKLIEAGDLQVHLVGTSQRSRREESKLDPEHPFEIGNYPNRWPVTPFTQSWPTLEAKIPFHLLPERLVVHDPWDLLKAGEPDYERDEVRWGDVPDIVHTYHLSLSPEGLEKRKQSKEKALKEWENKCQEGETMIFGENQDPDEYGLVDAPVVVDVPPPPRPLTEVPEGHIYLSPSSCLGEGNHSYVYSAEWELPRVLFFKPQLCTTCIADSVSVFMGEKYGDSPLPRGTLKTEIKEVRPGYSVELVSKDEANLPKGEGEPHVTFPEDVKPTPRPPVNPIHVHEISKPKYQKVSQYEGEVVRIKLGEMDIQYQHPHTGLGPCCEHLRPSFPHPFTTTVKVTAKISKELDSHLENEADNYQRFPNHFFEHWSGYNLISPLHDPVPVGAVVPQFYGYYKPDLESEIDTESKKPPESDDYLSPILLLEDCGKQVDVNELSTDDRNECASLFYRFQSAGWLHQSVHARNVLMSTGSLFDWPMQRSRDDHRFRLIDFGRSARFEVPEGLENAVFYPRMSGIGNSGEGVRMTEESSVSACFGPLRARDDGPQ